MKDCFVAMRDCFDMVALKGIFAGAYKRANDRQKAALTEVYNEMKSALEAS
jgi:hypothetical protein